MREFGACRSVVPTIALGVVIGVTLCLAGEADLPFLSGGPPGPLCAVAYPQCQATGCSPAQNDPATGAVCCSEHPNGAGCCTYSKVAVFYCHNAQGQRCYCGSILDVGGGTCKQAGLPNPFTTCDTSACSPTRGQCL